MYQGLDAPIYELIWDEKSGTFYKGGGSWTRDRSEALAFASLGELMAECGRQGIAECRVMELFPRTGLAFSLHLRGEHTQAARPAG
jgi:hypothetical protein